MDNPSMHFEFTKRIEDKWSLNFLIAVPIIEFIRYLLSEYGTPKFVHRIQSFVYNVLLPPLEHNNNACTTSPIPFVSLCRRLRHSTKTLQGSQQQPLLPTIIRQQTPNSDHNDSEKHSNLKSRVTPPSKFVHLSSHSDANSSKLAHENDSSSKVRKTKNINLSSLNTYDAFKILSTITMLIDHYGYFGLPGLSVSQSAWSRVIGRHAAPGFFFLSGYSSKKFRLQTWFAALFLYIFTSVIPMSIVHSPWESIMNIMLINCILYYIPPHRIKNVFIHMAIFGMLQYWRHYASSNMNIGYGTQPFMFAIAGDLVRHKHYLAKLWVLAGVTSFAKSSIDVFSRNQTQSMTIMAECAFNAICMMTFRVIEIPLFDISMVTRFARNGLIWISRTGLLVYIGHLCMYRMIQLAYYSGQFRHMMY